MFLAQGSSGVSGDLFGACCLLLCCGCRWQVLLAHWPKSAVSVSPALGPFRDALSTPRYSTCNFPGADHFPFHNFPTVSFNDKTSTVLTAALAHDYLRLTLPAIPRPLVLLECPCFRLMRSLFASPCHGQDAYVASWEPAVRGRWQNEAANQQSSKRRLIFGRQDRNHFCLCDISS